MDLQLSNSLRRTLASLGVLMGAGTLCFCATATGASFLVSNVQPGSVTGATLLHNNSGSYVLASNHGDANVTDVTVDGTLFLAAGGLSGSVSANGVTLAWNNPGGVAVQLPSQTTAWAAGGDTNLGTLMGQVIGSVSSSNNRTPDDIQLTLSGLTSGVDYYVQLLMHQENQNARKFRGVTDGTVSSESFGAGVEGGASVQYWFTADNTGQVNLTIDGNEPVVGNRSLLNAFALFSGVPVPPEGDVNLDGVVNDADYAIIRDNLFESVALREDGDLNDDGIVDFADFQIWKEAPQNSSTLFSNVVPEPSSLVTLSLLALTAGVVLRTRSRKA
ncbi:hypothetical protein [Aeoliella sp. SH292]|uniref:hypothetical protein n=1 Tax=Aeoliella sp. SH292 TaxID=3454464 RepID=UPI003F98F99F